MAVSWTPSVFPLAPDCPVASLPQPTSAEASSAVVNAELRAFDHPNLFIEGSAVFPTGGAANPTLTIAALALRSVDAIRKTLRV